MENKDDLTGKFAHLPDGQRVFIETVYSDGYASVRRIDGERAWTLAVCAISKLEPDSQESVPRICSKNLASRYCR